MSDERPCGQDDLLALFVPIDIYLFDQLLRGRITPRMRVLDAGCGAGRNAHYLMRCGADVFGVDSDREQVRQIRDLAATHAPRLGPDHFLQATLLALPFADRSFDAVVCSAVLHFARDESEFERMLGESWRVLRYGGVYFARLASTIGIEARIAPLGQRRHRLPDGTERFLVDEAYLHRLTTELGGELLDPIKTTNVQNLRAMTTWVLRKPERSGATSD